MSNFYLKTPDGKQWLASDDGDQYRYHHMEGGYTNELLLEKEFIEKYGEIMQYAL